MSTSRPTPHRPRRSRTGSPRDSQTSGVGRTPVPGHGGPWVELTLTDVVLPVAAEDIVAALWLAAHRDELDPARVAPTGPAETYVQRFGEMARAIVLYLLCNDHAGILTARHHLATLQPGTHEAQAVDELRLYAIDLFRPNDTGETSR